LVRLKLGPSLRIFETKPQSDSVVLRCELNDADLNAARQGLKNPLAMACFVPLVAPENKLKPGAIGVRLRAARSLWPTVYPEVRMTEIVLQDLSSLPLQEAYDEFARLLQIKFPHTSPSAISYTLYIGSSPQDGKLISDRTGCLFLEETKAEELVRYLESPLSGQHALFLNTPGLKRYKVTFLCCSSFCLFLCSLLFSSCVALHIVLPTRSLWLVVLTRWTQVVQDASGRRRAPTSFPLLK
jgi:hypothetical protein